MGRCLSVIMWPFKAFAVVVCIVIGLFVATFGAILPKKEQEADDGKPKTEDATKVAPEEDNDDAIRRLLADCTPAERLDVVDFWHQRDANEVGRLTEPVEVWGERRRQERLAAAAERN